MPIKRDTEGFTRQHNAHYPEQFDAGDSCRSDGLLAMAGNVESLEVVTEFWMLGPNNKPRIVRHPFDEKWASPSLTSRDQVISLAGGLRRRFKGMSVAEMENFEIYHAMKHEAETWFVNKDIKLPHYRLALYNSIYLKPPLPVQISGTALMRAHIATALWDKTSEVNQTISMLSCFDGNQLKDFCDLRGNVISSLAEYWAGFPWRDQKEIGSQIVDYLVNRGALK